MPLVGQRVGGIDWPADTALVAIVREGRVLVPQPEDPLEAGDELLFVTRTTSKTSSASCFPATSRAG